MSLIQETVSHALEEAASQRGERTVEDIQRDATMKDLRTNWNAPGRHLSAKNLDRNGPWGETEKVLASKLGKGFLFGLIGGRGPGKTQLAIEIMRAATGKLLSSYYVTAMGFFIELRSVYGRNTGPTENDVLEKYKKFKLLVIDEIGQRAETAWEDRILAELVNARYGKGNDTLLVSNHTQEEFREAIGSSIASRMNQTGGLIECNWKSYRDV